MWVTERECVGGWVVVGWFFVCFFVPPILSNHHHDKVCILKSISPVITPTSPPQTHPSWSKHSKVSTPSCCVSTMTWAGVCISSASHWPWPLVQELNWRPREMVMMTSLSRQRRQNNIMSTLYIVVCCDQLDYILFVGLIYNSIARLVCMVCGSFTVEIKFKTCVCRLQGIKISRYVY